MKKSSLIGLIIIAIAIAMVISSYSSTSTYGNFKDAENNASELHIIGRLSREKSLIYDATIDANYFAFFMKDELGKERKVIFIGAKPQDFERSEQLVLTGKMVGKDFHASNILMKCPSKYTNDKIETYQVSTEKAI